MLMGLDPRLVFTFAKITFCLPSQNTARLAWVIISRMPNTKICSAVDAHKINKKNTLPKLPFPMTFTNLKSWMVHLSSDKEANKKNELVTQEE